jgi:hypothetical protein
MPADRFCDEAVFDPDALPPAPATTNSAAHNI